jgi:methyl coenzyme M reductase gamma subunit
MLLWTFWWIIASLLLIMLIHYLYIYMKNTLTVPIVEDTATKNKQRYDDMLAPVQVENIERNTTIAANDNVNTNENDDSMKDELQAFLNELKITGGAQDIGTQDIGAQDIGAQGIGLAM